MKQKNRLFLVILFTILLTSCSFDAQTQSKNTQNTSTPEETQVVQNTDENEKQSWNWYAYTQPAKLTQLDTKMQQNGNTLSYGQLQITLPDGVTIEEQTAEQDMCVIDFIGMESIQNRPFPPRIWFANYHAEYENLWALLSKLLEVVPNHSFQLQYNSGDECCWLFVYTKPYKTGYILLYENDVYLVEEISAERDYSFGGLLDNEAVMWENDAYDFTDKRSYGPFTVYNKIKVEEDMSFVVLQGIDANRVRNIHMFLDGYFFFTYHEFEFEEWEGETKFEDCNFDGCLDMIVSQTNIYLWNSDQKEYEAAQIPEDLPQISEEGGGNLHEIDDQQEHQEYIPQALLDIVTKAMLDGTELETLKGFVNDKKLTREEILILAKDNIALRSDIILADWSGDYIMVMTDADNDGIMDIVAEEYFGGTAGFTEYVLYKGQEDGTYQKTSSYDAVKEEFAVLCYEEKNYLCRTLYHYDKKIYNGISLACYVDGTWAETATLTLFPEKYDIKLAECSDEKYKTFAENILKHSLDFKEMIDEGNDIIGNSEEQFSLEEQYEYRCDLDNDGVAEQYHKSVYEPSNMWTYECLHFSGEGEGIEHINDVLRAVEGTPIMMWVEPLEGKNVINVISSTGLDDFEITGFLVNSAEYEQLYRITADAVYGVCQERSGM